MRALHSLLLFGILCSSTVLSGAPDVAPKDYKGIALHFLPSRSLEATEIDMVIDLARTQGITNIASIRSVNVHPSSNWYIQVAGAERTNNRVVEWDLLNIDRVGWLEGSGDGRATAKAVRGLFWVGEMAFHPQKRIRFTHGNHSVRVRVREGTSLELADQVFAAIAQNRIDYATPELRAKAGDLSLQQMTELAQLSDEEFKTPDPATNTEADEANSPLRTGMTIDLRESPLATGSVVFPRTIRFHVSYDCGSHSWISLVVRLEGSRVVVLKIFKVIS